MGARFARLHTETAADRRRRHRDTRPDDACGPEPGRGVEER